MRRNLKRWAVPFTVAALCAGMAAPMHVLAAEKEVSVSDDMNVLTTENVLNEVSPITVSTTQRCSVWSAPATTEENRIKYVDEGYQITVYPEVVASALGDGKTFYRTIRGAYILCRCVDGADGSGAESGSVDAVWSAIVESLGDDRVTVRTERRDNGDGFWSIWEYGEKIALSETCFTIPIIRDTIYRADGTILEIIEWSDFIIDESGHASQYAEWYVFSDIRERGGTGYTAYKYDGSGYDGSSHNCLEARHYYGDGSIEWIDITDESGNWISVYKNG